MRCSTFFPGVLAWFCPLVALAQYEPPAGYYNSAVGTGLALKSALHNIIDDHVVRSYDSARDSLQLLDRDPDQSQNVIEIYTGWSVLGEWDQGVTWNREHQWPVSLGVGSSGPDSSELFNLRPCDPGVNGSRSNSPYGIGPGFWDPQALALPGVNDRGDCSRSMFYMAVRYDGSDVNTVDLELVNGLPGTNQMGDLARMLEWHYTDPVDGIELRRNHLIWSSADNPQWFQGNRNPFIDHPEFVWAIWGPSPNDSRLYLGDEQPADGASTVEVEMRALVGSSPEPVELRLNKTGATPTTFDVLAEGDPGLVEGGAGLTFAPGGGFIELTISWPPTASAGLYSVTLTFDNTDLTSAGPGLGAADGDDVASAAIAVLNHAEASFSAAQDADELILDLGTLPFGSRPSELSFSIHNLDLAGGPTAGLLIVAVAPGGDTAQLSTDAAPSAIAGGGSQMFSASFDPTGPDGSYQATYVIDVADEALPGAEAGQPLVLTLTGSIEPCTSLADCADLDADGVRDEACTAWTCAAGACLATEIRFADMGGEFGACQPEGVTDASDRFHALNCFSDVNILGQPGYTCEDSPPQAYNVDAGGPFGSCAADGVCDGNDAFHALNAFEGSTTCSCPLDGGPMPKGPHRPGQPANVVGVAGLALDAASRMIRPGELIEVDVYLEDTPLPDLRGYQLHLGVSGGTRGMLELVDIFIREPNVFSTAHSVFVTESDPRSHSGGSRNPGYPTYTWAGLKPAPTPATRSAALDATRASWTAFNIATQQMLAGLDGPGIAAEPGAYLATFVYRASRDAAGTFEVELLHAGGGETAEARTFLFPTPAGARILIGEITPARVRVVPLPSKR